MKRLVISFFILLGSELYAQQDPIYSQYMQNPLVINPAYAGTYNMAAVNVMSRWQWLGMAGAPRTNVISGQTAFYENRLGAGVIVSNDRFGISNNTEVQGNFAYKLRLADNDDHALSFGMQVGMVNYNFNYNDLKTKTDDDPNFLPGRKTSTEPNFGAGVFYRNEKMFAGISAPKILNSEFADGNTSIGQYRRHYFFTGGYLFDFINVQFKPSVLVKYVEGAPVSIDLNGSVLLKDKLWLGASLRNTNSIVLMAQLQLNDNFRLGYSLDTPLNSVVKTSYGTHELMLNIDLKLLKSHDIGLRYF